MLKHISESMYNSKTSATTAKPKVADKDDDIFVNASNTNPGKLGVSLKGRTAYITPEQAENLIKLLELMANKARQNQADNE